MKKGHIPWNKGLKMWAERKHPRGTLGMKFPNKKPFSKKTLKKMSTSHLGKPLPPERKGQFHHWWRGGKTTETVKDRACMSYVQWRTAVFYRDEFRCIQCGAKGHIHAHHIIPFADSKEKRFEVSNGITLCWDCHGKIHGLIFTDHALNRCKTCQKRIKVGARFCLACRKLFTSAKYKCSDCGKLISRDKTVIRCRSCAARIRQNSGRGYIPKGFILKEVRRKCMETRIRNRELK